MRLPNGTLKLPESTQASFREEISANEELDRTIRARFLSIVSSCCPSLPAIDTWTTFSDTGFDSVQCTPDGGCWASGSGGRVATLAR